MGLIKGLIRAKLYILAFAAGYITHSCVSADERYSVKRIEHKPYLVDTSTNTKLRIFEPGFQTGSIEHRIRGLLAEPELKATLEELTNDLEGRK